MHNKSFVIAPLLFLFALSMIAQDVRHYQNISDTASNNFLKLEALDSVLSKTFRKDTKTFIKYSQVYINLAKEMDSIEDAARKAMNLQQPLTNNNDPEKSIVIINGVLAHKYKIKDSFLLGGLYLKKGLARSKIDFKKAVEDYTLALENFSKKDSIHIADALLLRGHARSSLGEFVSARKDFNDAYIIYEALKDYPYMLRAQQGKITMFSINGFYELARKERSELIDKLKALDLKEFLSTEYFNQALDYQKTGDSTLRLQFLLNAKENLNDTLNTKLFINIHSKLSEYYSEHKDLIKAKQEILHINPYYEKVLGDPSSELNFNSAHATFLIAIGDYENSLYFANKKLENAEKLGLDDEVMDSHLMLSGIHKNLGNYKKSLDNKDLYTVLRDSLYNRSNANSLAYYQTLFDMQKKEKELVEKNTNIKLLEKDTQTFKKVMFFISLAIMLAFGIILLSRNRQNLKSKKNLQEGFSQKLLVSQEQERMRISKDLHDGIGQQLLVIKNKLITKGDQDTMEMVDKTIDEVRNISRDLHPFALQELGITKAIEHTIRQIDENTSLFISSEIDNIDNLFTPEEEVNIYRIVQESLSNIIKHAKAEASKVLVKRFANNIIISIKDNGVGFDFNEKYQDKKSLGLKTLLERTKVLKGQMKVISKIENGTIIEYKLPLQ